MEDFRVKNIKLMEKTFPTKYTVKFLYGRVDAHPHITIVGYYPTPCYVLSETKVYSLEEGKYEAYDISNKWQEDTNTNSIHEVDYSIAPMAIVNTNRYKTQIIFDTYQEAKAYAGGKNTMVLIGEREYIKERMNNRPNLTKDEREDAEKKHVETYKNIHKQIMKSADTMYEKSIKNNEPTK